MYLFVKMKMSNYSELHFSEGTSFKIHNLVHLDFQTFLRPCAIDGLWARLFWHLWMHVVFDSPADPTNLNKKESCSCSISPQSETCLPTTRHLFALCFRKMPVVEVCHMSTHKIWIQIHSTYYLRDAVMDLNQANLQKIVPMKSKVI